ncbi:uncharacterized protein LOC115326873 [Ixodes scapularis]|uniref:uncharacterized protein LOC115326873 n=1 Tax=Ixodes scapularis TaxID=6945 RepID=UPI001A9FE934|nr:uncharacterized protein LOC115326873 [Ixodes scapularis]
MVAFVLTLCWTLLDVVTCQIAVHESFPMGDYMKGKRARLDDVTISEYDIPNVPDISDRRNYPKAVSRPLPSTPTSASTTTLSWADGREVSEVPGGTPGVGPGPRLAFGSACGADRECDMALGLRCLGSGLSSARCACGHATPVFVQEKDGGRCVRAKAIYESCAGDTECNIGNPNMRCVDFLCYCPLPFVLTDAQHCLPPQVQPEVLGPSGVVPALLILFLLLAFGGVYVYHW